MGKIILYGIAPSPPARAVHLTLKTLNLPFEYKVVDLVDKSPEFLRINPQGTVPTLDDDGHIIADSHAIMAYLASKYDKTDSLYPKDLAKRSIVDQRLYYEASIVFERTLITIGAPIFVHNDTNVPQFKIDNIIRVYETVNNFLKDNAYVAGDHLTIADFSLVTSVASMAAFLELDTIKYPKLAAWIKNLEKLPYYAEANGEGLKQYIGYMKSKNLKIVQ